MWAAASSLPSPSVREKESILGTTHRSPRICFLRRRILQDRSAAPPFHHPTSIDRFLCFLFPTRRLLVVGKCDKSRNHVTCNAASFIGLPPRRLANRLVGIAIMSSYQVLDRDQFVDLESGGTTSEDEDQKCVFSPGCVRANKILNGGWSGFTHVDESLPGDDTDATRTCGNSGCSTFHTPSPQSVNLVEQDQKISNDDAFIEKPRKKSPKKAPKPPRPPKPPSLDAADHKLIKEISDLAMLKRARIERMKALRKARATKSTSSSSNMWAMVITIAFCLVIILQGTFSRGSSNLNYHNSPEAAMQSGGGAFISIQYHVNAPGSQAHDPVSQSPNIVEQMTGSEEHEHKTVT